jgi:hypothetical protein
MSNASQGVFSEKLGCGADLQVTKNRWWLQFYFPGPDLRYKGEFLTIEGKEVQKYFDAYTRNYNEYLQLKQSVPPGGNFEKTGEMGMIIRTSGPREGVAIHSYHLVFKSREGIAKIQNDLLYAMERGPKIMEFLSKLE